MLSTDNRDLALDANNNLIIDTDLHFTKGIPGVVQECKIKLSMFKGEWFLDRSKGISWWGEILGQKPDRAISAITSEFYTTLMGVEDVISVTRLDIRYVGQSRALVVTWAVQTRFGDSPPSVLRIAV